MENFATKMMLCTSGLVLSQIPKAFSYQGILMNNSGETTINKNLRLKITLVDVKTNDEETYSEMHNIESNNEGLFNIDVGKGIPLAGTFNQQKSITKAHYVRVEMDTNGQSNYQFIGTVVFGNVN